MAEGVSLFQHVMQPARDRATLSIDAATRAPHPIQPYLLGKFCEHLGSNIYNGMEAQILRNPTFGKWCFGGGDGYIDGGATVVHDTATVRRRVRSIAERTGLPTEKPLLEDYEDGAAFHWFRVGSKEQVLVSPDAGARMGRAQRVETLAPGLGLGQWTHLPLHRTRGYVFRVVARAATPVQAQLSLATVDASGTAGETVAHATLALRTTWHTFTGKLTIPETAKIQPDGLFRCAITSDVPMNLVLSRVLLYPDDHVNGADPDVIRLLKESRLPLLRWPGGNFVSGYHWRNGVGPIDLRPTLPNPAWEGLEYNLFGTDEFVAFCRAVGCEPMLGVNGGDGTAEEAAAWVQYCNGSADSPMGRLRAENGHPEPFGIKLWEIGNEITGRHQIGWTTPAGNVDRYLRFVEAMRAVDPTIQFLACGAPWGPDCEWNRRLVQETQQQCRCITDHILTGGSVNAQTDFNELYHAFLGYNVALGQQYRAQRDAMLSAGIKAPRLAITELQLFAQLGNGQDRALAQKIPTPATISEALFFTTIMQECVRMGDFAEMITHSATVNHGGGLRKIKERVWANPVHYAHAMSAPLGGATPLAIKLTCGAYSTQNKFGLIPQLQNVPVIDALAALAPGGQALTLLLVHRGADTGPIALTLEVAGFNSAASAEVLTLAGENPCDQNTADNPERITPRRAALRIDNGRAALTLPPFSLTRVTLTRA